MVEMGKLYEARRKYHEKKAENEGVLKEFGYLDESSTVYKLVGPVLAKQNLTEAKQTVEKRLAYICKELYLPISTLIGSESRRLGMNSRSRLRPRRRR